MVAMAKSTCFENAARCSKTLVEEDPEATVIHPLTEESLADHIELVSSRFYNPNPLLGTWVEANQFKAKPGQLLLVPPLVKGGGTVDNVLAGVGSPPGDVWGYAALPGSLPPGTYQLLEKECSGAAADAALLGWMLGCYKFDRYKAKPEAPAEEAEGDAAAEGDADAVNGDTATNGATSPGSSKADKSCKKAAKLSGPQLVWPAAADSAGTTALAEAFYWARDMINTPAEDMGPQQLVGEAEALAAAHGPAASIKVISGEQLLEEGYPAIHTVGRASCRPPALIDLEWAPEGAEDASILPLVALVGKGVCFDSGGLNLKGFASMKLMKKDMGGAALMLALAHVVMSAQLQVRLRVLVPAVENSVSGNAYRPLDVLQTRAGLTVENHNTDAEGRLILSDALFEAASAAPDLLIDAATLTGAARMALGPELPAVFSNDGGVWDALCAAAEKEDDLMWRLPLHPGYRRMLDSKVADIRSTGEPGGPGAVTAALFLQEFAKEAPRWVHIDTGAWVAGGMVGAGRPEGGEALGLRALWSFLKERYP